MTEVSFRSALGALMLTASLTLWTACADDAGDAPAGDVSADSAGGDADAGADVMDAAADGGSDVADAAPDAGAGAAPLPALERATLTLDEVVQPTHAVARPAAADPRVPENVEDLLALGFGEHEKVAGESTLTLTQDGADPPAPGEEPRLLARLLHLADVQLADDESPARVVDFDSTLIRAAFRPQEAFECRILNGAVRAINAINAEQPLDLVVLGGDNIDNAQRNELTWFQDILAGAPSVECDSGNDDDPVAGPGNDPKDPFVPVGLDVPWLWVNGNHDVLVQGNLPTDGLEAVAIGTDVVSGTRDWSLPGGPMVTSGQVPSDASRALLSRVDLATAVAAHDDGHGLGPNQVASGRADYTFDIPDSPIRLVVVDSAAETGAASGLVRDSVVDDFLRPALDAALAADKLVVVVTHHGASSLSDGGGFGGTRQPDAITAQEWQAVLGESGHVVLHLAAHSHVHRVRLIEPDGGHPYWEMRSAAIADFPHQMRLVEIHDQDNGFITITGIAVDFSAEDDGLAAQGRRLGILDMTSGWAKDGSGDDEDRNVVLWLPAP